jgi:DNA-binding winged helix-turn-helix (wHTH) protein
MDVSTDHDAAIRLNNPGRFTHVFLESKAGEMEARLSEYGNWEVRVRRHADETWRLACSGDLDCGAVSAHPVVPVKKTIACGSLVVDPAARSVVVGEERLALSRKEFSLLVVLASKPDCVFSKQELLQEIWGYDSIERSRTLDSHASRLRCKLAAAGAEAMVINVWGTGYKLWNRLEANPGSSVGRRHVEDRAAL